MMRAWINFTRGVGVDAYRPRTPSAEFKHMAG